MAHLKHIEIATLQLDNTLEAIDAQQVSGVFTFLANNDFHLHETLCVTNDIGILGTQQHDK